MRRLSVLFTLALLAALGLTACGGQKVPKSVSTEAKKACNEVNGKPDRYGRLQTTTVNGRRADAYRVTCTDKAGTIYNVFYGNGTSHRKTGTKQANAGESAKKQARWRQAGDTFCKSRDGLDNVRYTAVEPGRGEQVDVIDITCQNKDDSRVRIGQKTGRQY